MDSSTSKKQSLKVLVSEALMVVTVIVTVIVLALLVSGYWLNSNFEVQRNGMLQVSSSPTGASVSIDGQSPSWLERTNYSKILSSGEHSVKLSKEGYDTWSKTIKITEGLLYNLHYPRLFPLQRKAVKMMNLDTYNNATISPDQNYMLLTNATTEWLLVNLDADTPTTRKLDISPVFSGVSLAENASIGLFTSEIVDLDWDRDSSHILFKVKNNEEVEWVLLDINNIDKSINLNKEFGSSFADVEIINNNSSNLLAIRNGNLHKIDVPGRAISAVIVKNILNFDHYNNEIVFAARHEKTNDVETASEPSQPTEYYIGYFKLGNDKFTELEQTTNPVQVLIGQFYDNKFVAVIDEKTLSVHQLESYSDNVKYYQIQFSPSNAKVGSNGEFVFMNQDSSNATLDMEAGIVREWTIENDFGWLDNNMLYTVNEGDLTVYDFDGLNRRVISHNVSSHFPVGITDNKWLYYFSDGSLVREQIIL